MINGGYQKQVGLLLDVLPEVAKEDCFALHGGTAINLFVRNMPRLSVDVDLTYTKIAGRSQTLAAINAALGRIKARVEKLRSSIRVQHKTDNCKLLVEEQGVITKIEVNVVTRGVIGDLYQLELCPAAQQQFNVFCSMPLVPISQLYGGKLCAALDRQHPRDLFDIKLLLENEGLNAEIKTGLIFGLLSSNRPTQELLAPNLIDQQGVFENQFKGMSAHNFTYADYETTRLHLWQTVLASLNEYDRNFLFNFNRLDPDWSIYPYQQFPSVKWKQLNLENFKRNNPSGYEKQLNKLEKLLFDT